MLPWIFFGAGVYALIQLFLWIYEFVDCTFLKQSLNLKDIGGDWALVTGSTDGIGKAYAQALASKGLNIILVSRSPDKLASVSTEIREKYGVKTQTIDVDFSMEPKAYMEKIRQGIVDLKIGILVNNVGMSYEHPEEFLLIENGGEMVDKLIQINIHSVNAMVRLILPQMVERNKGAIVNISSFTALFSFPLLSAYAASKAYVANFTKGLEREYRSKGITIQCILPAYVCSNMSKIRKPSTMIPTAETFVKSALSRLGTHTFTSGYWAHDVQNVILNILPDWFVTNLNFGQLSSIKARALKKKTRS